MVIRVNGREESLTGTYKLLEYLQSKGVSPATVVVERNGEVPRREDWGNIELLNGDVLEIVRFVGGG